MSMPSVWNRPRLLSGLGVACLLAACGQAEPPAPQVSPTTPNRPVTFRTVQAVSGLVLPGTVAGDRQLYALYLKKNQLADLVVEQRGADVTVSLYAPDRHRVATVDSVYGKLGPEVLPAIAEVDGTHRLEIRSADSGSYELRILAVRPANARDRDRVAAERLWNTGEELRGHDDRVSLEAAAARDLQALDLFQALGEKERAAAVLHGLGNVHLALGRNTEALGFYERALALFRALGREREAGRILNDLGKAHRAAGNARQALDRYREALALNRRLGERPAEAVTLANLGKLYADSLGETGKALDHYERALTLWRELGDRGQEAATLRNLGDLYQFLGEPQKALDVLEPALTLFEAEGRSRETAGLLTTLGDAYSRSGQGLKASGLLQRALILQRRIGDRWGEGVTLNDLGWVHLLLGHPGEARAWFERAAPILREAGNHPGEAAVLASLAWTDTELGRPRQAIATLNRVLPSLPALGDRDTEAMALLALARARRQLGDLPAARRAAEAGIARVESLRGESASHEIRTSFLASKQAFYTFYVDLLMDLRDPAAALAASEEARARSLLDLLAEARAGLRHGISPALLAREAEAARRVNGAEEARWLLAQAGASPQRLAPAERELRQVLTRYDQVQSEIRLASPRYSALAPPHPLSTAGIQRQVLDPDTLLLEYALGPRRSWLWAVTPESVESFQLPPRAEIEETAHRAYSLLAASRQTLAQGQARLALAELSRILLSPAVGLLGRKRLLIVGDGALHFIPFAALPVPGTERSPEQVPLIAEHEIVTAPSASSLAEMRLAVKGRGEPAGTLAVVADPIFATPGRFARLPFSHEEARTILALAPPSGRLSALRFDANRDTVLSGRLAGYRVVHFATHGVLDTAHPELSGIVLSQLDRQGMPREGFVRAHEIYRLSLPADLVVLSACSTALGREIHGEGLVGLTRGFQYAGARGVLVSLWEVEDRATAELMRLFYQEMLQRGRPPVTALRSAQTALREEPGWKSPYYWAGFVLQGDWQPARSTAAHPKGGPDAT